MHKFFGNLFNFKLKRPSIILAENDAELVASRSKVYSRWEEARASSTGYDTEIILERALAAALAVKRGEAAYERDTVLFLTPDYRWQMLACLSSVAACRNGQLHVMDVGGAFASVYLQHRPFLDMFPNLAWSVVEQPNIAKSGREHIQDRIVRFFDTIDDVEQFKKVDMVLFLSSLQYMRDPYLTLKRAALTEASHMIVDRISFLSDRDDQLVVQEVPEDIYPASYPKWELSEERFFQTLQGDLHFREIARYVDGIDGAGHAGFFFERV